MDRLELNLKILDYMQSSLYDPNELIDIFMTVSTKDVLQQVLDVLNEGVN